MSRGEIVIVVAGDEAADESTSGLDAQTVLDTLLTELPASQAAKFTAKLCNVDRAAMYELAVQRKKS
jgi:16S rRNA C1402 (ribose-2'-O) methylase RsmI